ncbi:MAG: hypothetical protein KDA57_14805 [Planctomycetales bacterium]|nr:hypothetical protein [Planctomycetales bacterium]
MNREERIAKLKEGLAKLEAEYAAFEAEIEANPMDPELRKRLREEYEAESERRRRATPPDTIFFDPGPPEFDERIEKLNSMGNDVANQSHLIDCYERLELPDGTIGNEATFAKAWNLDWFAMGLG